MRGRWKKKKLKEFNYKFHNNVSKIDEYEKEPAYKRLGQTFQTINLIIQIENFCWNRQQQRFTVAFKQLVFTWQRRLTNSNQNEVAWKSIAFSGYFFCFEQQGNLLLIVNFFKFARSLVQLSFLFLSQLFLWTRKSFSRFSSSIKK
jgi:hypothetical protein